MFDDEDALSMTDPPHLRHRFSADSIAELSSLGELDDDHLNFAVPTTTRATSDFDFNAPPATLGAETETEYAAMFHQEHDLTDMHATLFPREVQRLVDEAMKNTGRLVVYFSETAKMLNDGTDRDTHASVCTHLRSCIGAFPGIALPDTQYEPPAEVSWRAKRRAVEESLLKNLRKYIRFSDHFVRKPARSEDRFHEELNKLYAFADKFFDLSFKFSASNEKLRLLEICDNYQKMKLEVLERRQVRAKDRADRAARKTERARIRQQRERERADGATAASEAYAPTESERPQPP